MPDLWPKELGAVIGTPPIKHLREQADFLTSRTNGELVGRVRTSKNDIRFVHSFDVIAPLLDNYTYTLFVVVHDIHLYPVQFNATVTGQSFDCHDEAGFLQVLKDVLASSEAKRIIGSLLAQILAETK